MFGIRSGRGAGCGRRVGIGALTLVLVGCWPAPGGGPDRRSFNPFEEQLTVANVGSLGEAFRVALPGVAGAPVVSGRGLFVSSVHRVHAFDRGTGAPEWEQILAQPNPNFPESDGLASISDPYVDGDRVVVSDTSYQAGGVNSHRVSTLSTESGAVVSQEGIGGRILAKRGATVATGDWFARFQVFGVTVTNLESGSSWGGYAGGNDDGSATLGTGRLYTSWNGTAVQAYDLTVPCTPQTTPNVSVCTPAWSRPLEGVPTAAVISDDAATVYVASSAGTGYALDAATGEVRWSVALGSAASAPPASAEGTLYFPTAASGVVAVDASGCGAPTCSPLWRGESGAAIGVQPVVAGGVVYAGSSDGVVHAFDAAGCGGVSCGSLWSDDTGAGMGKGLAVSFGRLYVGTASGVVAYEPEEPAT